jgi:hypothetical protein
MGKHKGHNKTHHCEEWSWNSPLLHSKIQKGAPDECWEWLGARSQNGSLFGAEKNGEARMAQPNRLLYMEQTGGTAADISVNMQCGNRWCCNHNHWRIGANRSLGMRDE